jgi:very-short-patch-repair endonuclease
MAYIGKTRNPEFLYNASQETAGFARQLRKRMTPYEKILWQRLRGKNILGVKFRRQHPIGFYFADFYCHEISLVIEVDGKIHQKKDKKEHDENRSAEMNRLGIKVLRFTNEEIKHHIEQVMHKIRNEINQRKARETAIDLPGYHSLPSKGRAGVGS